MEKIHLIGGKEVSCEDYIMYLKVLGVKPFLSAKEASILFDIGLGRVQALMRRDDADFVMNKGNRRKAKIHRESFEKWLMAHDMES